MPLEVPNFGEVFAHFSVLSGESRAVAGRILPLAQEISLYPPELLWLLGESDLLVRLYLSDLRDARKVRAQLSKAGVPDPTWLFAVPYLPEDRGSPSTTPGKARFLTYTKVNPTLYQQRGIEAEEHIVHQLRKLIESQASVDASVYLCLGAPDLALYGSFDLRKDILPFLALVRTACWNNCDSTPLFSSTVSFIGFPWQSIAQDSDATENTPALPAQMVLAKLLPEFMRTLHSRPEGSDDGVMRDESGNSYFLDGRYDHLTFLPAGMSPSSLFGWLERHRSRGAIRTETHLLTAVNSLTIERLWNTGIPKTPTSAISQSPPCSCRELATTLEFDEEYLESILPSGVCNDIDVMLCLFRSVLTSSASCCDASWAARACHRGLTILLKLTERMRRHRDSRKERILSWQPNFQNLVAVAELWPTNAGKVLRERTADPIDYLFGRRSSIPESRGSLQKLLYLADRLVNEFYDRISTSVKSGLEGSGPCFATVYEPIETIKSERYIGIIRVPSRYAFSLHLVLPQLWHEVGQFIFQNRFGHGLSELTVKILATIVGASREQSRPLVNKFLMEAADAYSDLIVLHYGFHGDLGGFADYLISTFLETFLYSRVPSAVQGQRYELLIRRVYYAAHFSFIIRALGKSGKFDKKTVADANGEFRSQDNHYHAADRVWRMLAATRYIEAESLFRPSERERKTIAELAAGGVRIPLYDGLVDYMVTLLSEIGIDSNPGDEGEAVESLWEEIVAGRLIRLQDVSATTLFSRLYRHELERLIKASRKVSLAPEFRMMAALGRSCHLDYLASEERARSR